MTFSKDIRSERDFTEAKDHMQLTPLLARQWAEDVCAAWDAIQPMERPWRDLLRGRDGTGAALKTLSELACPAFAKTDEQRLALSRMRLLLDALSCCDPYESGLHH